MFELLMIYLLVQAEHIARAFSFVSIIAAIGSVLLLIWMFIVVISRTDSYESVTINKAMQDDPWFASTMKWVKRGGVIWVTGLLLANMTPSQQNMAIIVGSSLVYQAATSETGQRLTNKGIQLLEQKIDEILNAPDPKENKETPKSSTT